MSIVNIAGYVFGSLKAPENLRSQVRDLCRSLGLKGTVILSPEGVNCSLAGEAAAIIAVIEQLPKILGLDSLPVKQSYSDTQPFDRMLVKLKPRLLPVVDQPWDPALSSRTQLPPETLRKWLREKKDVVLLDTRNDYEYDIGTFEGAERCDISTFRKFQDSIASKSSEWKKKTVVAFCTGGIRCEKAVPVMLGRLGFKDVYQLEGGILQYFETVGSDHWQGDCFVFDKRVALNPALEPRPRPFCIDCGKPILKEAAPCTYCQSVSYLAVKKTSPHKKIATLNVRG